MCRIVEKYANDRHDKAANVAASCFLTPESDEVRKYRTGQRHWALKRNNPTVRFPRKIANVLRVYYNEQNPHCSPDEAATRLAALPEYKNSLYVRYVMEPGKIKAFFATLKSKKVNGVVPALSGVGPACNDGYKQWTTVADMAAEYERRLAAGTMSKPLRKPSNKPTWAALLELNDLQTANTLTTEDEETTHADASPDGEAEDDLAEDCDDEDSAEEDDTGTATEKSSIEDAHLQYDALDNEDSHVEHDVPEFEDGD